MDKKIGFINILTMKLLPVIFLLLCSCVVYAQMPTELIVNPNKPKIEEQLPPPPKKEEKKQEVIVPEVQKPVEPKIEEKKQEVSSDSFRKL